ncbi:M28 family metallopeptidase [Lysobacter antibioticus]|uniref:M28 family metallopeptidase n=1 Tax=Lysobacter antibioticus TaxID=84531 RepID=UPI001376E286|nr:M28 family metallopeptidase [Lysobacter antibioticus]
MRSQKLSPIVTTVVTSLLLLSMAAASAREAAAVAGTPASATGSWLGDVRSLSQAGASNRRAPIEKRLDGLGLKWKAVAFETAKKQQGQNLIAEVSGAAAAPLLLFGAHFDQVEEGHGATDNASGSATVLALAERFKHKPLAHHRVAVAFWDLEEAGLLGSSAYIAQGSEKPALYVNFDVFGWGDTLWMMTPDADSALVGASRDAVKASGLQLSAGREYPPSDHLPFIKAGWPAVSYSLIGNEEVPLILSFFKGEKTATQAKVIKVIHSSNDTVEQIDAAATARGVDAVERAIRQWDAAQN